MPTDLAYDLPGLRVREVALDLPLDRSRPQRGTIEVFARVVTAHGGEDRPFAVYLQGGPGVEAPRPSLEPASPSWLPRVLEDYRLILLDQRGTGRSTPLGLDTPAPGLQPEATGSAAELRAGSTPAGIAAAGSSHATLRTADPAAAAEYLTHFRADAIVEDSLDVLAHLGGGTVTPIGQSFGGFTTLHWMSTRPETLSGAIITGGLPAVGRTPDEVYSTTWEIMRRKSLAFYRRFPGDRERMEQLADLADDGAIRLPNGDAVSPARLRSVGHRLGATGGAEQLHWLLGLDHRGPAFRHDLAAALPYGGRNPLYAVIHESSMADGHATRWAAERTMPDDIRADPTLLGGEHVHPGLFDEDTELAGWKDIAHCVAEHTWPSLYDPQSLAEVRVPSAAIVYFDDAYVPTRFSLETAALVPALTPWVTNEWEHNGIRASGTEVIDRLIGLVRGTRLP
ncbi:alpha/beta fold hydrolase [Brevibacterium jeotgali]|uniref:Proline iminopeptidase n=1 Tax=Brevibacterium jeotgali TaxID=1262550 RepID=A0A2H1L3A9_9MICO|nr:alpha/beta fold hydrolase [Brevibacterium jeotgali]TWC02498.1 prolyl aminopeptidase 2 [Brevibacterium jeotgali]SMY11290.1 proline iminopeptidase [Brevibacterium jeotgali]